MLDMNLLWWRGLYLFKVNGEWSMWIEKLRDSTFTGGYIQGGYMLTDDARNYNAYFAQFWRIKPKNLLWKAELEHGKLLQEQAQWI